jgi:hypothetical protein
MYTHLLTPIATQEHHHATYPNRRPPSAVLVPQHTIPPLPKLSQDSPYTSPITDNTCPMRRQSSHLSTYGRPNVASVLVLHLTGSNADTRPLVLVSEFYNRLTIDSRPHMPQTSPCTPHPSPATLRHEPIRMWRRHAVGKTQCPHLGLYISISQSIIQ